MSDGGVLLSTDCNSNEKLAETFHLSNWSNVGFSQGNQAIRAYGRFVQLLLASLSGLLFQSAESS
jgi:hypothetical protein